MALAWLQVGARLLLDCSQAVPNRPMDVQALGADFIVATGHKMCGPTGIGFLWGRRARPIHVLAAQFMCLSCAAMPGASCTPILLATRPRCLPCLRHAWRILHSSFAGAAACVPLLLLPCLAHHAHQFCIDSKDVDCVQE